MDGPPLIEKRLHFIWLGGNPIPSFFKDIRKVWEERHPDFTVKLWQECDLPDLEDNLVNKKMIMDTNRNPAQRADLLRLEVLKMFGGIYLDVDMACVGTVDWLLPSEFFVGISNTKALEVNNAAIGAVKGSNIVSSIIEVVAKEILEEEEKLSKANAVMGLMQQFFDPAC